VTEHIKEINTIENNGDLILREALVEIVNHKDDLYNLIRWKEFTRCSRKPPTRWRRGRRIATIVIKNG